MSIAESSGRRARRTRSSTFERLPGADAVGPAQGRGNRARGLRCRYRDIAYEAGDIRCTGSRGRVVRWQTAS